MAPRAAGAHGSLLVLRDRSGDEHVFTLNVPATARGIGARLSAGAGARIHLYAFHCDPTCRLSTKSTNTRAQQSFDIGDAEPGRWKIVVDAETVPAAGSTYRLQGPKDGPVPQRGRLMPTLFDVQAP